MAGGSKHGRKAAWKFIKDNWEELYNRYQGGFLISRLIKVCGDFILSSFACHDVIEWHLGFTRPMDLVFALEGFFEIVVILLKNISVTKPAAPEMN